MQNPAQSLFEQTLYAPQLEHDACGIGFVARINGQPDHEILQMALTALGNQKHRGAVAADAKTGDGSGILTQIPRSLMLRELKQGGVDVVDPADLALGMVFLPQDAAAAQTSRQIIEAELQRTGARVLRWRSVPTNDDALGERAQATRPTIEQVICTRPAATDDAVFERALYLARRAMEQQFVAQQLPTYIPSLSARTVIYKGLLIGENLSEFYLDLNDPDYTTALAVYHERYSTNTFPTWERAQPFRMLSHNGEINTLQGNKNWMRAREKNLAFPLAGLPADLPTAIAPVIDEQGSDSSALDNSLELLVRAGRDIRHAVAFLVPEAWENIPDIDPALQAFYLYHAGLSEPWDGPAGLSFSDGRIVGSALDRNGLRPARFLVTHDGLVVSGSEAGVVDIADERVKLRGRLGPGQMFAVDTQTGQFFTNAEIKHELAARQPYADWIAAQMIHMRDLSLPADVSVAGRDEHARLVQQMAFGYTSEELSVILKPMQRDGKEPVGSMGDDTPLAVLSQVDPGRPIYQFFKQRFAEVTNPPMDPLREEFVMSLHISLGKRGNILTETPEHAHVLRLTTPFLTDRQLAAIRALDRPEFKVATIHALQPALTSDDADHAEQTLRAALDDLRQAAEQAVRGGAALLIISDRGTDVAHAPIQMLLALGAVHHHLIRTGLRTLVSLLVESAEPREVHHMACLIGYGAEAINPYLALETVRAQGLAGVRSDAAQSNGHSNGIAHEQGNGPVPAEEHTAEAHYINALEKGVLKIMSKMGISPLDSYCGAQIFEAVGLNHDLVDECFTGTPSRLGGVSYGMLARKVAQRHRRAFGTPESEKLELTHPGLYKFKKNGEAHAFSPSVIHAAHKSVRHAPAITGGIYHSMDTRLPDFVTGYEYYREYSRLVSERPPNELRDLLEMVPAGNPVPLDEVEPIEAILQRFSTAAMSLGSTSTEAHETLAIAMNRLGGMSNSGEGGEAQERFSDERNSKIKQVASGRFGVTPAYLAHASELQIKMAQGSKPGEGGQLPGHKVSEEIARIRHTTPGVSLISPPPHHDIYSIEDLAQLIYDLKQVNPQAAVSVKLVATAGVGTIAAGVAKGYADGILISGHAGGTGASPLSSIKNAGVSWELGLAETQQTLILNGLRGRVRVRADGGMQNGRDVLIAALLGADEYSFGTSALVAEGCLMARACHANTCPVGIATQRLDLRAKFPGTPEMVMAFFRYVAQEVRELLASLGFRSLQEAVGRTDLLRQKHTGFAEADTLDMSPLLAFPKDPTVEIRHSGARNPLPATATLNQQLLRDAAPALEHGTPVELSYTIRNCERTFGATLSGALGAKYGDAGLPPDTVKVHLRGSAGQSFGAFNIAGVTMLLTGVANDYVGKSMAGGTLVVHPSAQSTYAWHENVIAGNTILYGATGGELFLAGKAGERFAVRNSGSTAVVEGVGDHGCEYMTGGTVVILGQTGYNFGAGMSGGVAYVWDAAGTLPVRLNGQLVQLDPLSDADAERVQALVQRHLDLTGSPRAAALLADWATTRQQFVRVMPKEMVAKLEATNEGTDAAAKPAVARGNRALQPA